MSWPAQWRPNRAATAHIEQAAPSRAAGTWAVVLDADAAFSEFGGRFFVLPNPMYGSWQEVDGNLTRQAYRR